MNNIEEYAKNIATLTLDMEKVCRTKEVYFCDSINLTPVEFKCLRYLLNHTFPQVKELAEDMDLTPSRITSLLNSLEKKDYITREISKKDRRIIKVNFTPNGKIFAEDIQNKYIQFHKDILSNIKNEDQLESMLSSLKSFQLTLESFLENKTKEE